MPARTGNAAAENIPQLGSTQFTGFLTEGVEEISGSERGSPFTYCVISARHLANWIRLFYDKKYIVHPAAWTTGGRLIPNILLGAWIDLGLIAKLITKLIRPRRFTVSQSK